MASTIENKALKQQFETLQKQQQEKLLRRKQKKDEKDRQKTATSRAGDDTLASTAFGIDDDLDLKLAEPPSQGSIYSEELVNHLNDQIREMKDETGRLYKLLSERDLELRQLRKKQDKSAASVVHGTCTSYKFNSPFARDEVSNPCGVTNETAATKIVELSKKVRELTADLEKERSKAKQSAKRCFDLENELHLIKENVQTSTTTGRKVVPASAKSLRSEAGDFGDPESKALQDKLKQAEIKNSEYRNQTLSLKKEISIAQKVIEQEVGEGATIQQLMSNSSGWRGRAQQIIALQKKVNELKTQLEQNESSKPGDDLESEMLGTSATARRKTAERQREQLRKIEKERKENQERMAAELKAVEGDYEALKSKLEASKARNKVLSNEVKSLKHQQQTLLEKGKHDDELIEALFKQQSQLKSAMEDTDKKRKETAQQKEETVKHMTQKDMKEKNLIDQLSAIVAEKESKVKFLEQEIEQLKLAHLQKAQMNGVNEMFERSSRPSTGGSNYGNQRIQVDAMVLEDYGTLTPAPQEIYVSSQYPINQPDQLTDRPQSTQMSTRPSTATIVPPSANPRLLQEVQELQLQCQEYKSLCQTSTVERDKLSELVQVLQNRIKDETTKTAESQTELLSLRRRNVDLEKRLAKANIDKGQSATTKRTRSKVSLQSINFEEDPFGGEANLEEVSTQLEIQRDENEALKAALQSTLQAKEEDLKLYNQMLDETKTIFLQGLRQYRQSTQKT